jgi:hypothetical protein
MNEKCPKKPVETAAEWLRNEYIVAGRYPGDLAYEAIGKEEAEEAREIVRRIKSLVEERVKREG